MQIIDYRQSVWPSSVPRNFATEPETWRDLGVLQQQIGDNDDASFYIDFEWNYDAAPVITSSILYGTTATNRFTCSALATGAVVAYTNLLSSTSVYINLRNPGYPLSRGRHIIRARVAGTTFYAQLDNEVEKATTGDRKNTTPTFAATSSTADMYIYSAWIRNDTTGKVVWSYPSFAENTRLATLSNVLTSNGVFESAAAGVVSKIDTTLDFRGNNTSKTFIGRVYVPSFTSGTHISELISQSDTANNVIGETVFKFLIYQNVSLSRKEVAFTCIDSNNAIKNAVYRGDDLFDRWITIAAVLDFSNNGTIKLYVDGIQVYSYVHNFTAIVSAGTAIVRVHHDPAVVYISDHKIAWAGVWNKAMSQNEIKAFNEYQYWTVPVSAGSLNMQAIGFPNLQWTLPDGTKSTEAAINQSVTTGNVICKYTGGLSTTSQLRINAATIQSGAVLRASELPSVKYLLNITYVDGFYGTTAELPRVNSQLQLYTLDGLTGNIADLPRVTQNLYLQSLSNITGAVSDLPRVTNILYLSNIPNLSGTTADLPRVTTYLYLNQLPLLTGTFADLPRVTSYLNLNNLPSLTGNTNDLPTNTGSARIVTNCPGITGALSVVSTNTPISFYRNAKVTPAEYDQTIQNIVNAGGTGGLLYISSNKTSASDANIATLQSRGWTVNVITDPPYVP